jgi:hypothetical protein
MAEDGFINLELETVMPAQATLEDADLVENAAVLGPVNAFEEDAFWKRAHWHERYYSYDLDYEDYAPAYCVGYVGFAQYGGDYGDAEKSLWANWERIKGDSRLSYEEARLAIRAAWDRMARAPQRAAARKAITVRLLRHRLRMPAFKLNTVRLR